MWPRRKPYRKKRRASLHWIAAGESGFKPAPKEQPPRKLSGPRTAQSAHTLERLWKETLRASADGITFSGKDTEGAPDESA